jgi:hypothetical protein
MEHMLGTKEATLHSFVTECDVNILLCFVTYTAYVVSNVKSRILNDVLMTDMHENISQSLQQETKENEKHNS